MYIFLIIVVVLATVTAILYNRLVRDRNRVDAAWSDIDVQLQRRHDLIPQLVKAIKQYAAYEKAALEAVTELRGAAAGVRDVEARGELEEQLSKGVSKLMLLAENYPDLKASANFLQLQKDLVETENYLQFARRFYNGAVRALNTRVESIPHNVIAGVFGFAQREFFQKSSDDVANVPLVNLGTVE